MSYSYEWLLDYVKVWRREFEEKARRRCFDDAACTECEFHNNKGSIKFCSLLEKLDFIDKFIESIGLKQPPSKTVFAKCPPIGIIVPEEPPYPTHLDVEATLSEGDRITFRWDKYGIRYIGTDVRYDEKKFNEIMRRIAEKVKEEIENSLVEHIDLKKQKKVK